VHSTRFENNQSTLQQALGEGARMPADLITVLILKTQLTVKKAIAMNLALYPHSIDSMPQGNPYFFLRKAGCYD